MTMDIDSGVQRVISQAIAAAEAKTSGEIFCVVTRASDDYRFVALTWAALVALSLPLPLVAFTSLPAVQIFAAQLCLFLLTGLASLWDPLRLALVPRSLKHRRAHRNALEQFLAHGLHTTKSRTGVLLFVSLAERHAEVIADEAIYKKVTANVWDETVAALIAGAGRGDIAAGFNDAIAHAGAVLAQHFPPQTGDSNELPDHLVVL